MFNRLEIGLKFMQRATGGTKVLLVLIHNSIPQLMPLLIIFMPVLGCKLPYTQYIGVFPVTYISTDVYQEKKRNSSQRRYVCFVSHVSVLLFCMLPVVTYYACVFLFRSAPDTVMRDPYGFVVSRFVLFVF